MLQGHKKEKTNYLVFLLNKKKLAALLYITVHCFTNNTNSIVIITMHTIENVLFKILNDTQ